MQDLSYVKELNPKQILSGWWQEVKQNNIDEFWKDMRTHMKYLLRGLIETTMQEEVTIYTGAEWNEKLKERIDYRNGYRYRDLLTIYGNIERLKVPRVRKGRFKTKVFKNYQRRMEAVDRALKDIFLAGVSTRRVGEALSCLLDAPISATTISNVTRVLDKEVRNFQNKTLLDEYQYLLLDGIILKVKGLKTSMKKVILVAYGITMFGEREIISFRQVSQENRTMWQAFLEDLYRRGLKGRNLKMITVDGHKGLLRALEEVYPFVPLQRCWAHKSRNIVNYLPRKLQRICSKEIARIYNAPSKKKALEEFYVWKKKWFNISYKAVHCLEKDLETLFIFFDSPSEHRKKIRTTNVIERAFREVRRRVRTMNCFSNSASCDRIIFAIFNHLNKHWKEHPLKNFNQFFKNKNRELTHFS